MEEERRLCFVAMTRAQKALYLSEAEGRNLDGSPRYPSRFLLDIDDSLLQFTHTPREDLIRQAREYIGFSTRLLDESSLPQGFAPARGSVTPSSARARFWSLTPRRGRSWCSSIPCPLRACSLCAQSWNGSEPSGRGWFRAVTL